MKFTVSKSLFVNKLTPAMGTVSNKGTITAIEGVLIETLEDNKIRISTYDMTKGVRSTLEALSIEQEGKYIINAGRLLQNRQPETALFSRGSKDATIEASISGYNHLPAEISDKMRYTLDVHKDEETGLCFKEFWVGSCLNLSMLSELEEEMSIAENCGEYYCYATHEQYFYPDYFAYQPEYPAKILKAAEIMHRYGYEYFFVEELAK